MQSITEYSDNSPRRLAPFGFPPNERSAVSDTARPTCTPIRLSVPYRCFGAPLPSRCDATRRARYARERFKFYRRRRRRRQI
jgi:hypothetical protein